MKKFVIQYHDDGAYLSQFIREGAFVLPVLEFNIENAIHYTTRQAADRLCNFINQTYKKNKATVIEIN